MNARIRTIAAVSMAALVAASCAHSSATEASGRTIRATYANLGHTISLSVGDTLVVDLRSGTPNALTWSVKGYPSAALRLSGDDPAHARFSFLAIGPGRGQVLIQDGFTCPGSPSTPGGPVRACPFANGTKGTPPAAQPELVIRPFELTVQVS
jgi:hypothetical protein